MPTPTDLPARPDDQHGSGVPDAPPATARSWRSWAAPAAGAWSGLALIVGALWATGVVPSPFGLNDPRAGEVWSLLAGVEPARTGMIAVGVGIAGVVTAIAARLAPGPRWLAVPALCLSLVLLLLIPDVRVIQNFAYLFFGYTGLWDGALAAELVAMVGGLLWALVALSRLAPDRMLLRTPGWAAPITYAAAALALPYPIVRVAWALGIPLGTTTAAIDSFGSFERLGLALVFGGLPIGGAILTIGLLRPWGETFPRWIPGLHGRRVPILAAVIPGLWAALLISQAGLRVTTAAGSDLGSLTWNTWGAGLPGLFFLPWGLTLAAAVYAYAIRRILDDLATGRVAS